MAYQNRGAEIAFGATIEIWVERLGPRRHSGWHENYRLVGVCRLEILGQRALGVHAINAHRCHVLLVGAEVILRLHILRVRCDAIVR